MIGLGVDVRDSPAVGDDLHGLGESGNVEGFPLCLRGGGAGGSGEEEYEEGYGERLGHGVPLGNGHDDNAGQGEWGLARTPFWGGVVGSEDSG